MLVRLDMRSEEPIYAQIARSIRVQIDTNSLEVGDRLPSARSLATSLEVNMHTVLKAYADLQAEGLVEVRRGRAGVVVTGERELLSLIENLIVAAKGRGTSQSELFEMIEGAWT